VDYSNFYKGYHPLSVLRFVFQALTTNNKIRRVSLINRIKDYLSLQKSLELLELHRELNCVLDELRRNWGSYDYGEGYFYQSFQKLNISGLRNTEERIRCMDLAVHVKGRKVLDIGCNTGFLSLSVADHASYLEGFDINSYLAEIANRVSDFLGIENVNFKTSRFEGYATSERFDVVLSFANHSTYDKNTEQDLRSYFQRCHDLLVPDGVLLFESHAPDYEGDGLRNTISIIERFFDIVKNEKLYYGSFLDNGRTFIVGKRRE
jgi:2-polyprenyl-3-methyl-5-hydroxy-6-metoxy-1,4-benzoquinol methylase